MRKPSSSAFAGIFALLGAAYYFVFWYIYLFTATPEGVPLGQAAVGQLKFSFSSESQSPRVFAALAALPLLFGSIGSAYLLGFAVSRLRVFILFVVTAIAGLVSATLHEWSHVLLAVASIYYGGKHLSEANLHAN